jgi:hypothetical protein
MSATRRPRGPRLIDYLSLAAFVVLLAFPFSWAIVILVVAFIVRITYEVRRDIKKKRAREAPPDVDGVYLGRDREGRPAVLSDSQLGAHGLIVGATGAGKTTTLLRILTQQIARRRPVVAIDLKGSPAFASALSGAARAAGRPCQIWTPDGHSHWNPLQHGNATELKDKLMSTERFTEPHYQRAAERYLQTAIQVLQEARPDRPVTLAAVAAMMEPETLVGQLGKVPEALRQRVAKYLSNLSRDQQSAILGLGSRLAVINESHSGAWLEPSDGHDIDLRRALAGGEVIVFSLNASQYGKLAANIASLIIQDLITVAGHRLQQPADGLAMVAIDEFSALDTDNVLNLLARARESRIGVLLSTQELADLDRAALGFKDQVLGIIALLAAHRQNVPASAELVARIIGTDTTWQHTYQVSSRSVAAAFGGGEAPTGLGTKREVEQFRIHPNVIKELPTGEMVLVTKVPTSSATIVRVDPHIVPEEVGSAS